MNEFARAIHSIYGEQKGVNDDCLEPLEKEAISMVTSLIPTNGDLEKYLKEQIEAGHWAILPLQNNNPVIQRCPCN